MGKSVIHFADRADIEIGTARCGARLQGATHTQERGRVTCLRCDSSLAVAERAPDAAAEEDEQAATPEAGEDEVAYWERCVTIYCERLAAAARERGSSEGETLWARIAVMVRRGAEEYCRGVEAEKQARAKEMEEAMAETLRRQEEVVSRLALEKSAAVQRAAAAEARLARSERRGELLEDVAGSLSELFRFDAARI